MIAFGSADLRFELAADWEQLPTGWSHPDVSAVSTDSHGNVYLFCRNERPVLVYDRAGRLLDTWGAGRFTSRAHGMSMWNDELYLTDESAHHVGRYSLDGKLLSTYGPTGVACENGYDGLDYGSVARGGPPYNRPTGVALAPSGDVYVSDGYGNARIHRFDPAGLLKQSWGQPGSEPGELQIPHSVWPHADGRVFVADRENDRIQIFSANGEFLDEWLDVRRPQDIFIDPDGFVYVAESGRRKGQKSARNGVNVLDEAGRVSVFDPDGNVVLRWGDPDGEKPGHFIAPHGLWVDDEGSLYVAEVTHSYASGAGLVLPGAHTLQKFVRT